MKTSSVFVLGLYFFVLIGNGVEFGASTPIATDINPTVEEVQPYRTAYHFQPPKNWMNDPNGPMYFKGIYHFFYQYNPYGPHWANIVWAHSVSYDLINWIHLDHALNPTHPFDINGCWSGSTTILPGEIPAILYTGSDTENREVQNLARPKNLSDPFLIEWVKSAHNPIMTPVDGIHPNFFRDPTTAWQGPDERWRVIVGSQINGHGTAILYTSEDFINWTRSESPLHSSNRTGMWECPDFYPSSAKGEAGTNYVLKASFNHQDHYVMGNYDPETDIYVVETDFMDSALQLRYDYGKFFGSKTFLDSEKKRRVLWAWIDEMDSEFDRSVKGWTGLQSFPRTVSIGKSGKQLAQWPIEEIEKLRSEEVNIHDIELKGGSVLEVVDITASQADVEVSFVLPNFEEVEVIEQNLVDPQLLCSKNQASVKGLVGPFGLLVLASKDLTEQTAIFFRIFRSHSKYVVLMCSDQSRSSLRDEVAKTTYGAFVNVDPVSETISLRSLIDHSIVESFGGEGVACITARVYPKLAIDNETHLYAFNNGTQSVKISKLSAWSMKKAQFFSYRKEESLFSNYDEQQSKLLFGN
ncbi:beta-fructofuranosidase, insoluble isoenzyme CWINV3-like isoform X1 [Rhododendron vialii]|uniref:beta-fructofuranosidase, insoluble isoenzyme CWINV3-like isoform X1 n=1 Tax=Rhododendron vialii TaxID=182163 RepID=UPI00265FBDF0|nr:beta-fructofuranosidase, insoluble isoenzyme CWINV3-like isoform X1 [Rhododendron vialii]